MGSSHSLRVSQMEKAPPSTKSSTDESSFSSNLDHQLSSSAPPAMPKPESIESRIWKRFQERPLLPIGCGITAYFLFSGIHYFQKRDPVNSQRMMRNRVIAQFMTLACFLGYIGGEQADFRFAPMYQEKLKKDSGSSNSSGDDSES